MFKWLFGWARMLPELGVRERRALYGFVAFVLASYIYAHAQIAYLLFSPLLVNKVSIILIDVLFYVALFLFLGSRLSDRRNHRRIWCIWITMLFFVVWCAVNGVVFNRYDHRTYLEVVAQMSFVLGFFYIIMIGEGGVLLSKMMNFFLFLFYASVILMIAVQNVNFSIYNTEGVELAMDEIRNTNSMAYYLKSSLAFAPFLFFLGVFWRKRMKLIMRIFYLAAIIPCVYFQIYLFKFRTGLFLIGIAMFVAMYYLVKVAKFWRLIAVVVVVLIGSVLYFSSGARGVRERFDTANDVHRTENIFLIVRGERFREASLMFKQLTTAEILFGRGFNAAFDASDVMGERGYIWKSIHLGFVSNILRGGVFYALLWLMIFIAACCRRLQRYELDDGFMIACKGLVIVETIHFACNPMPNSIYNIWGVMVLALCIGALWSDYYKGHQLYNMR